MCSNLFIFNTKKTYEKQKKSWKFSQSPRKIAFRVKLEIRNWPMTTTNRRMISNQVVMLPMLCKLQFMNSSESFRLDDENKPTSNLKLTQPHIGRYGATLAFVFSFWAPTRPSEAPKAIWISYKRRRSRAILLQKQFVESHTRLLFVSPGANLLRWELCEIYSVISRKFPKVWILKLCCESSPGRRKFSKFREEEFFPPSRLSSYVSLRKVEKFPKWMIAMGF